MCIQDYVNGVYIYIYIYNQNEEINIENVVPAKLVPKIINK